MASGSLTWKLGYSLSRKPERRARPRRTNASAPNGQQQLEFVLETPSSRGQSQKLVRRVNWLELSRSDAPCGTDENTGFASAIPATVEYTDLTQKYEPLLVRYNEEFCQIPLTADLHAMNPFRYWDRGQATGSASLVHAVMALAGHHLGIPEAHNHRQEAIHLLGRSLTAHNVARAGQSMLDSIILLFSLDEAQSLMGNWKTHLRGAYGVLEACGGVGAWTSSERAQAQVGILLWWDSILSLVAREDPVFPLSYFDALLIDMNVQLWNFFSLCGCPLDLVKVVMQLSRLAGNKQTIPINATSTLWDLEHSLLSWSHPVTAWQDEESMHQDQDNMHCSEAWRHGLLLYIHRVFYWKPEENTPLSILYRARVLVDHVFACRNEAMTSRQALLPLFFAASEMRDRSMQLKAAEFCSAWDRKTRYHMFHETIPLLQEAWAEQEWWGSIVDRHHSIQNAMEAGSLQTRICFG